MYVNALGDEWPRVSSTWDAQIKQKLREQYQIDV